MPQRRSIPALVALALASLAACASDAGISTSYDPLTRFPANATFSWDASRSVLPDDPRIRDLDPDNLIRSVAADAFATRGYTQTLGAADYLLSYQLGLNTWIGPDNSTSVASLSLLLVESSSGRRVWSGFARAPIHVGLSDADRRKVLRRDFDRMLKDFPPNQP